MIRRVVYYQPTIINVVVEEVVFTLLTKRHRERVLLYRFYTSRDKSHLMTREIPVVERNAPFVSFHIPPNDWLFFQCT